MKQLGFELKKMREGLKSQQINQACLFDDKH